MDDRDTRIKRPDASTRIVPSGDTRRSGSAKPAGEAFSSGSKPSNTRILRRDGDTRPLAASSGAGDSRTEPRADATIPMRGPHPESMMDEATQKSDRSDTRAAPTAGSSSSNTNSAFSELELRLKREFRNHRVLKQRFVLVETLGSGGMGNVYLARDLLREEMQDSHSEVAIKVLNDECRDLPGALQSLQREAKKAQTLSHPNIVTVYDFDRDGDTAFITMEYIAGDALKDLLRKRGRMSHNLAMYVIERVARGLAYAHQQGFVHADIKPANIFLGQNNVVKILDFGIAKAFTEASKEKRSLADDLTEGALTPTYASLEMLRGHSALPSDDVYSLACMAYEIMSGRHPFIGADGLPMPADVAYAQNASVENLPQVPRRHMRALRKGLEFERSKRFKNAGEFIDAIKQRNRKKDALMLASAALISGLIYFSVSKGLEQVVPSIDSLKPQLAGVAQAIREGDDMLAEGDIDYAHRLYAQAWELATDLTSDDLDEREKAQQILQDRRKKVSNFLIAKLNEPSLDEYQLRELAVALEFLLKDDLGGNEKRINKAIESIKKRLDK